MHALSAILTGIFVALVIGFALTFGVALFVVLGLLALVTVAIIYAQVLWRRWQITRGEAVEIHMDETNNYSAPRPQVIDAEYKDVTDKE